MNNYKEIVTKAIVGKSKKSSTDNFTIVCENTPNTILGCWVINHKFNGYSSNDNIIVNGSYDVNVWYSYDNDTKTGVSKETYTYNDTLTVNLKENISDGKEVIVRSLKQPTVSNVKIVNDKVELSIDKELAVEVVGNTKIKVSVESIDDDYEDITNIISSEEEIDKVNDDYLE
ncbi:MAG: outer spore coat protein CotE [Bacilli bacterium]|nr:outer spore coat protein CotE [Bacilli bacterium]